MGRVSKSGTLAETSKALAGDERALDQVVDGRMKRSRGFGSDLCGRRSE